MYMNITWNYTVMVGISLSMMRKRSKLLQYRTMWYSCASISCCWFFIQYWLYLGYDKHLSSLPLGKPVGLQSSYQLPHQQNIKWFGSHNWTTQQLWTATLILPDAPRCSQIGWVQSDELSGASRLLHRCTSIFWKLWNRIPEYTEECIVVFQML
jgi:hypothetical protein